MWLEFGKREKSNVLSVKIVFGLRSERLTLVEALQEVAMENIPVI